MSFLLSGVISGASANRDLAFTTYFGAVSSSRSYAAAAMARSLFQKGACIVPALAFMLASTNLVLELSLVLWLMMGWQFVVAELFGGILLVLAMATAMGLFAPLKNFGARREVLNRPQGDDGSDETIADPRTLEGRRQAARSFVMVRCLASFAR